MLVKIEHLYKYFNGEPLLKDINLVIEDRATWTISFVKSCRWLVCMRK